MLLLELRVARSGRVWERDIAIIVTRQVNCVVGHIAASQHGVVLVLVMS